MRGSFTGTHSQLPIIFVRICASYKDKKLDEQVKKTENSELAAKAVSILAQAGERGGAGSENKRRERNIVEEKKFQPYVPADKVMPEFTVVWRYSGHRLWRRQRLPGTARRHDRFRIHPRGCYFHGRHPQDPAA